jgi:AcrR family transcriptional regulator
MQQSVQSGHEPGDSRGRCHRLASLGLWDRRALITRNRSSSVSGSPSVQERGLVRGERRGALVAAAEQLFSRMPYAQVEISDIADEAGVSHGLLFYHFKDKRGIYLAVLTKMTADIIELWRPADGEASAAERLRSLLRNQIAYRRDHAQTVLAMIRAGEHDPEVHQLLEQARQPGLNVVYELLGIDGKPSPVLRGAVRGCMGFLDELTADWVANDNDLAPEEIEELAFKAIVAALSAVHIDDPDVDEMLSALRNYEYSPRPAQRARNRRSSPR